MRITVFLPPCKVPLWYAPKMGLGSETDRDWDTEELGSGGAAAGTENTNECKVVFNET